MIPAQIKKIAIIYDDITALYHTTAFYCRRALSKIGFSLDYYSSDDLDKIKHTYDLYLNIDDNIRYLFPKHLRPSVYWVIDTHMDYDWRLKKARMFDFVFTTQKEGADSLRRDGIKNVYWLPLACDPDIHKRYESLPKEYDISFVGNIHHSKKRMHYLAFLKKKLKDKNIFIGKASLEKMVMIYAKSKLVLNISIKDDINMRVFEALSCARPLLTDDLRNKGQKELFGDKPPFIVYRSKGDLLRKIKYYLCREDEREKIAKMGWQEAINKHTYLHRMQEIIQTVEKRINDIKLKYDDYPEDISVMGNIYGKVFNLIDHKKKVLDIGCATGRFSKYLVFKKECFVTGIEKNPLLCEKAKAVLQEVILGDALEQDTYAKLKHKYDFILLIDILERTRNPSYILSKVKNFLEEAGQVILTTPNIAYWAIRKELLLGRFTYESEKALDNEHARLFTYYSLKDLVEKCGYSIERFDIYYFFPLLNGSHPIFGTLAKNKFVKKIMDIVAGRFPNFFAYELFFILEKD